jgi:hypothetical protein
MAQISSFFFRRWLKTIAAHFSMIIYMINKEKVEIIHRDIGRPEKLRKYFLKSTSIT